MFSPGSKLMEATTQSSSQRRSCICTDANCKPLTLCFQSLNDVRGSWMSLPSVGGKRLSDLKEFKLKRTHVHLGLSRSDLKCTVDNRDQSDATNASEAARRQPNIVTPDGGDPPPYDTNEQREVNVRTRIGGRLIAQSRESATAVIDAGVLGKIAQGASPARSTKYIANHHFHPAVLQAMLGQGHNDCVSTQLIKDFGLVDNGYTDADLFRGTLPAGQEGPVYVPTPSYKDAKADYKLVSNRWRLNKMIAGCRAKSRGNCTLAP